MNDENDSTITFMFFFVVAILLIIMGIDVIFGIIVALLSFISVIIGLKWDYENPHLKYHWNPADFRGGKITLFYDEWLELNKESRKKAIKIYNKMIGISSWKRINKKHLTLISLATLILICALLGIYFAIYPMNVG